MILLVGTGEPLPYCNKNTLGKIEFEFEFGIGRPPLQSGQKTKFFDRFNLKAPLIQYKGYVRVVYNFGYLRQWWYSSPSDSEARVDIEIRDT